MRPVFRPALPFSGSRKLAANVVFAGGLQRGAKLGRMDFDELQGLVSTDPDTRRTVAGDDLR